MTIFKKAKNASVWQAVNIVVQAPVQFLMLSIISYYISPGEYGEVLILILIMNFFSSMSQSAVKPGLVRVNNLTDVALSIFVCLNVTISVVLFILINASVFIIGDYIALDVRDMIFVLSFVLLFNSLSSISEALLEKALEFKMFVMANIVGVLMNFITMWVLLKVGLGVLAIVYGILMQSAIRFILLFYFKKYSFSVFISFEGLTDILKFSGGALSTSFVNYAALNVDKLLIAKIMGSHYMGLYSLGYNIMDLPRKFLASVVDKVVYPVFSTMIKDKKLLSKTYKNLNETSFVFLSVVAIFMMQYVDVVIVTFWDGSWWLVIPIIKILLLQIPFRSLVRMSDNYLTVNAVLYRNAKIKFIYLVLVLLSCLAGFYVDVIVVSILLTIAVMVNSILSLRLISDCFEVDLNYLVYVFVKVVLLFTVAYVGNLLLIGFFNEYFYEFSITLFYQLLLLFVLIKFIPGFFGEGFVIALSKIK